jgi:hypothetical protein
MSKYVLKDYPDSSALLFDYQSQKVAGVLQANTHVHTPHSFSFFESIPALFEQAGKENISVLGINDFFTAAGFREFYEQALANRIFPMFNIEIVGLMVQEQYDKFRINDPVNPGRTYLCGKGLDYPFRLDEEYACGLQKIRYENQLHTKEIIQNANRILQEVDRDLSLKYSEIKRRFARDFVTERHVSRAIRLLLTEKFPEPKVFRNALSKLFGTKKEEVDPEDRATVENKIRSRFLKSGGRAFIAEDHAAFLPVSEVLQIILNAGGIPCYTVLLDDEQGQCTEYEANKQILLNELKAKDIYCIEFLPARNDPDILKDYARFFRKNQFIILFGTAHSTPDERPLLITTRDGKPLDDELSEISFEGSSVIAAHQYLRARGEQGYLDPKGNPQIKRISEFISLGKAVIHRFIHSEGNSPGGN